MTNRCRKILTPFLISALLLTPTIAYGADSSGENHLQNSNPAIFLNTERDLAGTLAAVGDTDSEGYIFRGTYDYDYGMVVSALSFVSILVSRGATAKEAKQIASAGVGFGSNYFYSKNDQWTKTDKQYIYVKTVVRVYERMSGSNKKLGSYTRKQKKALNGTVWIDIDETI